MVCEMFVLGNRDLRLPGLGSYLQTASNAGSIRSIVWGLAVMIGVIILIDQLIWRPVIAWSEKFKFEQVEASARCCKCDREFPVEHNWFECPWCGETGSELLRGNELQLVSLEIEKEMANAYAVE